MHLYFLSVILLRLFSSTSFCDPYFNCIGFSDWNLKTHSILDKHPDLLWFIFWGRTSVLIYYIWSTRVAIFFYANATVFLEVHIFNHILHDSPLSYCLISFRYTFATQDVLDSVIEIVKRIWFGEVHGLCQKSPKNSTRSLPTSFRTLVRTYSLTSSSSSPPPPYLNVMHFFVFIVNLMHFTNKNAPHHHTGKKLDVVDLLKWHR